MNRPALFGKYRVMKDEASDGNVFARSVSEPQAFTIIFERYYRSVYGYPGRRSVLLASGFGFGLGTWNTEEGNAKTTLRGLGFLPTPGWTIVQSETARPPKSSSAIASNIRLDAEDASREVPYATLRRLPPRGAVLVARISPRGDERIDRRFPLRRLPLRVSDAVPADVPPTLAQTSIVPVRFEEA